MRSAQGRQLNFVFCGWDNLSLESLNSKTGCGQVKFGGVCSEGEAVCGSPGGIFH